MRLAHAQLRLFDCIEWQQNISNYYSWLCYRQKRKKFVHHENTKIRKPVDNCSNLLFSMSVTELICRMELAHCVGFFGAFVIIFGIPENWPLCLFGRFCCHVDIATEGFVSWFQISGQLPGFYRFFITLHPVKYPGLTVQIPGTLVM